MKNNIHFFSQTEYSDNKNILDKIGLRGKLAMEFASLNLPILPGFIIDSEIASHLEKENMIPLLKNNFKKIEKITGKIFGDKTNPMLVKIVLSPNLAVMHYPTLHNFGLTDDTIAGFNNFVGENFGYHEKQFMIKGILEVQAKIAEIENKKKESEILKGLIAKLAKELSSNLTLTKRKTTLAEYEKYLPKCFFNDSYQQLEIALQTISKMLNLDDLNQDDTAILIQPMVYGNYGENSGSGAFYTRNIVTGEKKLQGNFFQDEFDSIGSKGKDIYKIDKKFITVIEKIARNVEDHFKEIRSIRFTIENNKLWLIDQRTVGNKSVQADIKTLLDLYNRKKIEEKYIINSIKPTQLNEILHPIVNIESTKKLPCISGGISGAPGAAIGRIFFSTNKMLEEYKNSLLKDEDHRFILCMPASFAEDVKAIEVSKGVLSSEGGYAAHASVVARQYGKVSLVNTDLKFLGNKVKIGDKIISEGDYITLNVPFYGTPQIFIGKAELIEPDPEESGMLELLKIVKRNIKDFHVRANADKPNDAALALKFGAEGIGLCRTEHMFFDEKRINVFREMIVSDTKEKRIVALKKLKNMQADDFYKIFKIMQGKEVTIRLLDAPLHEFLPHNDKEMQGFKTYLRTQKIGKELNDNDIAALFDSMKEFNPMLGHRGCRIAVSYPEIYEMQVQAIFEAAYKLKKEGVDVRPEIMIPIIMNENELKLIVYGKKIEGQTYKGIIDIEKEVREKLKTKKIDFQIGTMIELPIAALGAGEIAKYAEFMSFGTNDLTQTTAGLSRDDFNSFMPDYTQFDIIEGNPFQILNKYVKELILIAVRRASVTRPGIKRGLCGEHGAIPENIQFCMEAGLNYVSCSTYSVPIANLAVAQINLNKTE